MDNQWWKFSEEGGGVIALTMYHSGPPEQHVGESGNSDLWMAQAYDSFMVANALEAALERDPTKEESDRAYEACLEGYEVRPVERDTGMGVFFLRGSRLSCRNLAYRWSGMIQDQARSISGDDTYYDYFPDYVYGFWQLCKALGKENLYNNTRAVVMTRYGDDPEGEDLIKSWED